MMICFFVNGQKILLENPDPETKLLDFLRGKLQLTGTKQGCNEGGCGCCTVMISKYYHSTDEIKHWCAYSCLVLLCSLDGSAVTTIEGIGTKCRLDPCQERIAKCHGSQCGYCTPGVIMSMYILLRNDPNPTQSDMQQSLHGNLCRCTGYRSILDSFRTFCKDCPCSTPTVNNVGVALDSTQEVIFPPELKLNSSTVNSLVVAGSRMTWYRPVTLSELLNLREQFPASHDHMIVAGNIGIGCNDSINPKILISVNDIDELQVLCETDEGLLVGGAVTIGRLEDKLIKLKDTLPVSKVKYFTALIEVLHWFGSTQIKNVATIGGNIIKGHPSSDFIPILIAAGTILNFASKSSSREVTMTTSFHTQLSANEVLVSLTIPYSNEETHVAVFRQSKRRYLSVAIATACMSVKLEKDTAIIKDTKLVYGGVGVGDTVIMAKHTQSYIIGRVWNSTLLNDVYKNLLSELSFQPDIEGGTISYRLCLCLSFFYKFYLKVQMELGLIQTNEQSALKDFKLVPAKGSQSWYAAQHSVIGQPIMNLSAIEQSTGEATYIDDIPHVSGEAYAGLMLSQSAHANFTVDISSLNDIEGILGYVSVDDVPANNIFGDEPFFADGVVTSVGQIIGIVVAKNKEIAKRGAKLVKVNYTKLPTIITIEEAKAANSYIGTVNSLSIGKVAEPSSHSLTGSMSIGGQKHFYMETCSCIVIPRKEKEEIELIGSTQFLTRCQKCISSCLGIPSNRVTARAKRIGGAFGGKLVRPSILYTAIAVAANKFQVPVRVMLERKEDMLFVGSRHPFNGDYRVGFTEEGRITTLDVELYSNGGASPDFSISIMQTALAHLQNVYNIPNARFNGRVCKTNIPSCPAMRAYGRPQAQLIMETIITHIAEELGCDPLKIRELNFIKDGEKMVNGWRMEGSTLEKCWSNLMHKCSYHKRKEDVDAFNKANLWKKRGISVIPTCSRVTPFNQATALVHVYTDGSVLVTHGGMEMGQGLHTKMAQVCAQCLDLSLDKIHISETNIDKVPNAGPTGGSVSNDIYGMAIKDACEQIMQRLKPYKEDNDWNKCVNRAFAAGVNLSAQGFYHPPDVWEDGVKVPYCYYCFGVGFSMVEIDTLTGNWQVMQTDIVMDVGDSLNPAIDIGQIEGAFVQGMGLFTMEECSYLADGSLYSVSPSTYKIPGCSDIPIEMNITLLEGCPNPKAIFSSKAVGEPPLFLASSVFFAIRAAVKSAREERGFTGYFEFCSPATTERIRLACEDHFTKLIK